MTQITNHMPTKELQALDAAHHMHPFTDDAALAKKGARIITRGKGVWLTDSEGEQIIDGMAGLWCVSLGYGRKDIAEVAARQMEELCYYNTFFQTSHVPAIALAAEIAELAPGDLNHVFYAGSGSEANDTNIRLVRRYWDVKGKPEKNIIIARLNGYHGSTMGGGSLGGMSGIWAQGGLPIPNITHIGQPYWYGEGGDMTPEEFGLKRARELEAKIEELGADRVAAFIGEPIQGAGGVIVPPSTYWPEIQRICDKYGILLIADEVITGFGRTGNWFGSQTFGIKPAYHDHRQGPVVGLRADRRFDHLRRGLRDGREFGRGLQPRLHLFRPSGRLCRRAEEPRNPSRRRRDRTCARRCASLSRRTLERSGRSPAGGRGEPRRPDGFPRADARQGNPRAVRL